MTTIERIAAKYRKQNNLDFIQGVLGTEDGRVLVDEAVSNQLVYVRFRQAGGYTSPSRHYARGNIPLSYAGVPVILQRNENNQLEVVGVYREGGVVAGFGDGLGNTSTAENMWTDAGKWPYLYCTAMTGGDGTQATASTTEVGVSEWNYIDANGNYTLFPGGLIDLSGDIPDAGEWLVALVYLNQDNELASSISTAQDENIDPLDFTDRQEALDNAIDLFVPIRFWVLRGGATTITNKDRLEDARIWINDRVGLGSNVRLLDGITKTVKAAGGDYTTIQDAYDYFAGGKLVTDCTIEVDAGTYTEALLLDDLLVASPDQLEIIGDTRALTGFGYVNNVHPGSAVWAATTAYSGTDPRSIVVPTVANGLEYMATVGGTSGGAEPTWPTSIGGTVVDGTVTWTAIGIPNNRQGLTNGGSTNGGCQLLVSGVTLTVLVSGGNPNFAADSWVAGDTVICWDGTNVSKVTLTAAGGSTLTAASWPAGLTNFGAAIVLKPDRIIQTTTSDFVITATSGGVKLTGFHIETLSASVTIYVNGGQLNIASCSIRNDTFIAALALAGGSANVDGTSHICENGAHSAGATANGSMNADFVTSIDGAVYSLFSYVRSRSSVVTATSASRSCFFGDDAGRINASGSYAINGLYGFRARGNGTVLGTSSFALDCTTGVHVTDNGVIRCFRLSTRNSTTGFLADVSASISAVQTSSRADNNTANYSPATSNVPNTALGIITWS